MSDSKVSMKLLIDTKGKRVLFAEAGKDCVDFLFHILSLPVATIISLLKAQGMEGSLPNLYKSLESLSDTYVQPDQRKDTYLKPVSPLSSSVPLLAITGAQTQKEFYRCGSCNDRPGTPRAYAFDSIDTPHPFGFGNPNRRTFASDNPRAYVSDDPRATCPSCDRVMTSKVEYVAPPTVEAASEEGGLVKGVVTYMVMDDLMIKPMSTISSITMLNKFNVKEVGALEEKVVNLGMNEAVKLLKTSLQSEKVLTDVFLDS